MNFIPSLKNVSIIDVVKQVREKQQQYKQDFSTILLLQPDESYAFSFVVTPNMNEISAMVPRTIGHPEVKWCTSMGEFSLFRGSYLHRSRHRK